MWRQRVQSLYSLHLSEAIKRTIPSSPAEYTISDIISIEAVSHQRSTHQTARRQHIVVITFACLLFSLISFSFLCLLIHRCKPPIKLIQTHVSHKAEDRHKLGPNAHAHHAL